MFKENSRVKKQRDGTVEISVCEVVNKLTLVCGQYLKKKLQIFKDVYHKETEFH